MTVRPHPELVERLRKADLLTPQQWHQFEATENLFETAQEFANALVGRGWLTSFQALHLLKDQLELLELGGYRLLEPIGTGGQGEVFRALQVNLNREVALKRLRAESAEDAEALRRLLREAKAVARLAHPNIVHVYDWNEVSSSPFIVMEYVRGSNLSQMVQERGPLLIPEACDYIRQAALGLEHAHQNGLIHRDIKPSNLFVAQSDGGGYSAGSNFGLVKVLDLGLARLVKADSNDPALTRLQSILGTPDYISPEQAHDSSDVDHRADLYSLGCTFYFLLAGHPPYPTGSSLEKILKHQTERPKPITETRRGIPAGVLSILARLMRKSPQDRYQKAAEAAEALREFMEHSPGRRRDLPKNDAESTVSSKPPTQLLEPPALSKPSTLELPPLSNKPRSSESRADASPVALGESLFSVEPPAPKSPLESINTMNLRANPANSFPSVSLLLRGSAKRSPLPFAPPQPSVAVPPPPASQSVRATPVPSMTQSAPGVAPATNPESAAPTCRVIKAPSLTGISPLSDGLGTIPAHRISVLQGHTTQVIAMAFAPRGQFLTTAGLDHSVRVWRIDGHDTRQETSFCDPRLDEFHAIAYAPGGGLLVSASGLGGRVWHWKWRDGDGAEFLSLEGSACASALAVAADGKHVAAACGNQIFIWAINGDQFKSRRPLAVRSTVTSLAFSADGQKLFAGQVIGEVQSWTDGWRGFRESGAFAAHAGPVNCLSVSPNNRLIATAGTDNVIRVWSSLADAELHSQVPTGAHGVVRLLQFGPRNGTLATVSGSARVTFLRSSDAVTEMDWRLNQGVSSSFALADHLEMVAAARTDGTVCLYQLSSPLADTTVDENSPNKKSAPLKVPLW